jgi:PhoH-like ATPase
VSPEKNPEAKHRIYALDTNVLLHDPTALWRFEENDVFLPAQVILELDRHKSGTKDTARNARQVSRFLDRLISPASIEELREGISLAGSQEIMGDAVSERALGKAASGNLLLDCNSHKLKDQDGHDPDGMIIQAVIALSGSSDSEVVLVSKDINLRIRASISGISAEDYENDHAVDDLDVLPGGWSTESAEDFWSDVDIIGADKGAGRRAHYRIVNQGQTWPLNHMIRLVREGVTDTVLRVVEKTNEAIALQIVLTESPGQCWGIAPRNDEQAMAMDLLLDPDVHLVSLLGQAGSGKTLLALAAALEQTLEQKRYREIIVTRATVPAGEEIGFLPGTEEEKMSPWMGALYDNLEVLNDTSGLSPQEAETAKELVERKIKVRSTTFMRGRTWTERFVIIDEAQNLTPKQIKMLVTRVGEGTKLVLLGNLNQIDTPYLTEYSSGLTYAVQRLGDWEHAGNITLSGSERSKLAARAGALL